MDTKAFQAGGDHDRRPPVVVGIDGSRAAIRAAAWAAVEAASRSVPLRLIRVVPAIDQSAFRPGGIRYRDAADTLEKARSAVLARRSGGDGLEIRTAVLRGQPEQVLIDLSRSATMIALGTGDIGFFSHMVLGSTTLAVTREAQCPVALVRRATAGHGSILVVVGTWYTAKPALLAAFRAAQDRGADVTVARIWQGRPWSAADEYVATAPLVSDALIEHYRRDFPTVMVRPVTVVGDVVTAIERFSATAQLIVVGHDADQARPDRLGRIADDLVRHTPCPVLVVPDQATIPAANNPRRTDAVLRHPHTR